MKTHFVSHGRDWQLVLSTTKNILT